MRETRSFYVRTALKALGFFVLAFAVCALDSRSQELSASAAAKQLVGGLSFDRFKANIEHLAGFGTRHWRQEGNLRAGQWIQRQLESYGYAVERHTYQFRGESRDNIYATKVGTKHPDKMYIVSAHMDSFNTQNRSGEFAPGADDDGSGTSLVLEAARAFAMPGLSTEISVRFILWNNEETGLNGSKAYHAERARLQGQENPRRSGQYPEPQWLGLIQHDMILFDHGLPPGPDQNPQADIDIEYRSEHSFGGLALDLAMRLFFASGRYSSDYPAQIGARMSHTDSQPFWDSCPAVSVRENQRLAEIGNGANPNWHKNSDVVQTYSEKDFRLGFNAVQMTVGAVAELAGARF